MKLFRKKTERACRFCTHAMAVTDERVICAKKKKYRSADAKCFRFRYDPLKRVPHKAKAVDFSKYEAYDYSL